MQSQAIQPEATVQEALTAQITHLRYSCRYLPAGNTAYFLHMYSDVRTHPNYHVPLHRLDVISSANEDHVQGSLVQEAVYQRAQKPTG